MAPAFFEQFCHPGHDLKTSVYVAYVLNHHLMFCRLACGIPQLGTFFGQAKKFQVGSLKISTEYRQGHMKSWNI